MAEMGTARVVEAMGLAAHTHTHAAYPHADPHSSYSQTPPTADGGDDDALQLLESLQRAHTRTIELERLKREIARDMELLAGEEDVLAECRAEREALAEERRLRLEELQAIHADVEALDAAIAVSTAERDALHERQRSLEKMYEDAKDEVDSERAKHGLAKLPHFRDERDALQALYLERRRARWREAGADTSGGGTGGIGGGPAGGVPTVASLSGQGSHMSIARLGASGGALHTNGMRVVLRAPPAPTGVRKRGRPRKTNGTNSSDAY